MANYTDRLMGTEFIDLVCEAYGIDPRTVRAVKIEGDVHSPVLVTFTHFLPSEIVPQVVKPILKPKDKAS